MGRVNSAHRLFHGRGLTEVKMTREMYREGPTVRLFNSSHEPTVEFNRAALSPIKLKDLCPPFRAAVRGACRGPAVCTTSTAILPVYGIRSRPSSKKQCNH